MLYCHSEKKVTVKKSLVRSSFFLHCQELYTFETIKLFQNLQFHFNNFVSSFRHKTLLVFTSIFFFFFQSCPGLMPIIMASNFLISKLWRVGIWIIYVLNVYFLQIVKAGIQHFNKVLYFLMFDSLRWTFNSQLASFL